MDDLSRAFAESLRPRLFELLSAIRLDVRYERARGDQLYYRDARGEEVAVLDLLGGFGASLLGHHHPEIVAEAKRLLDQGLPIHAQASVRGWAGLLARKLSERVGGTTGRAYVATLANSGAEAIEAAIKHAEMERTRKFGPLMEHFDALGRHTRAALREGRALLPDAFLSLAQTCLGLPHPVDLERLFDVLRENARAAFERPPLFLALEKSFHGKTTGALGLTHKTAYRHPFRRTGLRVRFLPMDDAAGVSAVLEEERTTYFDIEVLPTRELFLSERSFVNISACFVEPLQGEGGIHPISAEMWTALREAADAGDFPLVIDEIQSGLGRTGTFLASEISGVRGDYYTFSKALGGGLAKISALLVDRDRYAPEFGELHTSTFADDDFSSAIALKVLELIERDDAAVIRQCRERGDYLLERLGALQQRFPEQLAAVRGRGLLLGVELAPQLGATSPLLRVLSEQDLLGFVVSGYLLHEKQIRVAPTLSSHGTLRLEPSAFISREELDAFLEALQSVLVALRDSDVLRLCGYLADRLGASAPARAPVPPPASVARPRRHVGFLAHFLEPSDLKHWEPGFSLLSDAECGAFLERTSGLLEPFVVETSAMRSAAGEDVGLTVFAVPFTPGRVIASLRAGEADWALQLVKRATAQARALGCDVLGFGGYTSIVTDNCRDIIEDRMVLTSGNALTAAAAVDALFLAAGQAGIEPRRLGVVGAAGNIGAVMAEIAADQVSQIVLVGRPGRGKWLARAAAELYASAWDTLRESATQPAGIAAAIALTQTAARLRARRAEPSSVGETLRRELLVELGELAPIRVEEDLGALRTCSLILCATNSPKPVVFPEHVGEGPVVICDVATPRDVDASVAVERPLARVLKGGRMRAPFGQELGLSVLRLDRGQLYGCLAEALLLGMAGAEVTPSYGRLTATQVRRVRAWARIHGFGVAEQK